MSEFIDRIELMRRLQDFEREIPKDQIMDIIERVPKANDNPPSARWEYQSFKGMVCSRCGKSLTGKDEWSVEMPNFCPNCGAYMRGEGE